MNLDKPNIYRKQCKRWDIPFDAHCLTFSCFKRQPFFHSEVFCQWFLESLAATRTKQTFALWAYVIMPEHVHLVLLPIGETKISDVLKILKLSVARRVLNWARKSCEPLLEQMRDSQPNGKVAYRFWQQGGGYDRNLRSSHDVHEKIQYVHANPVRRGLVDKPEDWPWSSYEPHCGEINGLIHIDLDTIPVVPS